MTDSPYSNLVRHASHGLSGKLAWGAPSEESMIQVALLNPTSDTSGATWSDAAVLPSPPDTFFEMQINGQNVPVTGTDVVNGIIAAQDAGTQATLQYFSSTTLMMESAESAFKSLGFGSAAVLGTLEELQQGHQIGPALANSVIDAAVSYDGAEIVGGLVGLIGGALLGPPGAAAGAVLGAAGGGFLGHLLATQFNGILAATEEGSQGNQAKAALAAGQSWTYQTSDSTLPQVTINPDGSMTVPQFGLTFQTSGNVIANGGTFVPLSGGGQYNWQFDENSGASVSLAGGFGSGSGGPTISLAFKDSLGDSSQITNDNASATAGGSNPTVTTTSDGIGGATIRLNDPAASSGLANVQQDVGLDGTTSATVNLQQSNFTNGSTTVDDYETGQSIINSYATVNLDVAGISASLSGNYNTVTCQSSDQLTETGVGSTVRLGTGDIVTDSGNATAFTTSSQGETINLGSGISGSLGGSGGIGDTVNLSGGDTFTSTSAGVTVNLRGISDTFNGSGDTANLDTAGANFTVNGSDTIDASVAGTLTVGINDTDILNGVSGDVVDLSGGDIFTSTTGGLSAYLTGHNVFTGSGDTAYLLTPSQGNTINGNDTIDAEAAGTVAIGINDTDTLTGVSGDVVDLAGGDIFTSTTGGLSAYLTGHNVFTGSGDTAYLLTPSQGNTIYGNDTIDAEAAGTVAIGINDTDTLTGVSGDVVDLAGGDIFTSTTGGLSAYLTGHNVFTGSGDTAYLLTPSQGNTINGNDTIDAEAAGTVAIGINDTDTLTGVSGDVVDLAGGDVATCNGAGLTANLTGSDVVTLSGSGDVTNLLSSGDASTVNLASACSLSLNGSGASFFMSPGDIVNVTASESGLATDIGYGVAGDKAIFSDSTLGNSQFQEVEPSAATLLEYSDYSGLDATGKLENTTLDNTNGTSATTWYNPTGYANVIQATDQFTAVDDGGNLTSEVFTTTANQTYDDSFVYNAGQITDVWQEVSVTSTGVELADDEFNDAGTLVDEVFGYAAGYQVTTGYAYSYAIHSPGAGTQAETHQRPAELALRGVARTSVFDTGSHGRSAASPYAGPGAPAVPVAAASPYSAASVAKNPSPGAAPASSNAASGSALAATEPVVSTAPHFIDGSGAGGNEHSIATPVTAGFVADDPSNASSSGYSAPSSLHDIATGPAGDPAELAWYGAPQPPTPDSAGQARSDRAGMVGLFARYGYAATFVHDLAPFVHVA